MKRKILFICILSFNFLTQSMDTNKKRKRSHQIVDKKKTVPQAKRIKKTESFSHDWLIFTDQELDKLWEQAQSNQKKPIIPLQKNNYKQLLSINILNPEKFEQDMFIDINKKIRENDKKALYQYSKLLQKNPLKYDEVNFNTLFIRGRCHRALYIYAKKNDLLDLASIHFNYARLLYIKTQENSNIIIKKRILSFRHTLTNVQLERKMFSDIEHAFKTNNVFMTKAYHDYLIVNSLDYEQATINIIHLRCLSHKYLCQFFKKNNMQYYAKSSATYANFLAHKYFEKKNKFKQ